MPYFFEGPEVGMRVTCETKVLMGSWRRSSLLRNGFIACTTRSKQSLAGQFVRVLLLNAIDGKCVLHHYWGGSGVKSGMTQ